MSRNVLRILVLLALGLVACTGVGVSPVETSQAVPKTPRQSTQTPTTSPDNTASPVAPAATATRHAEPTQNASFLNHCALSSSPMSSDFVRQGSLIFHDGVHTRVWDAGSSTPRDLDEARNGIPYVSPYGETIAWPLANGIQWQRVDGSTGFTPVDFSAYAIRQWLANDQVLVSNFSTSTEDSPGVAVDTVYVVPLVAGPVAQKTITLPWQAARGIIMRDWKSELRYDPFLRAAVYVWQTPAGAGIMLFDVVSGNETWVSRNWSGIVEFSDADWRLDGSLVTVAGPALDSSEGEKPELLAIDVSGNVSQLTNLQNLSEFSAHEFYHLRNPTWSPDGRYISTILVTEPLGITPLGDGTLLILDTSTQEVTDYCLDSVSYEFAPI
jgi:hypothetical protein